jgi:23S rRNA (adenine-N6)-dimethyltransferase
VLGPRLAAELVRSFDIRPHETVVEIGAGSGRLTRELTLFAAVVLAIEVDPALARRLLGRRDAPANLFVHRGDALAGSLPPCPFRLVGNIPFGISTGVLRRFLSDDRTTRADLIVQFELARKMASPRGHLLPVLLAIDWHLELMRRIPARRFHPVPAVDAAWLSARRRRSPLVGRVDRPRFERMVRRAFRYAGLPLRRSLGVRPILLREAGCSDARAIDLDVWEWVRVFEAISVERTR